MGSIIVAAVLAPISCASDPGSATDAGTIDRAATTDTGPDAQREAGPDAQGEAGPDAQGEAGPDAQGEGGSDAQVNEASIQCLRGPAPAGECGCQAYGCIRVGLNVCSGGRVALFCDSAGGVRDELTYCNNSYTDGAMCDGGFGVVYCCPVP